MVSLLDDLRFGLRLLWRHRSFSILALFTIALGIGANTTVFSLIRGVVLKPLPYKDPGELVWIGGSQSRMKAELEGVSIPDLIDLQQRSRTLRQSAAYSLFTGKYILTGIGEAEQVNGVLVTANFFDVLGVPAAAGRTFRAGEDKRGAPRLAVISHALWMRDFAGDPKAVGRNLTINSISHEVIGVMPAGFQYPADVEIWLPIAIGGGYTTVREAREYVVAGRAAGPAGIANFPTEIDSIGAALEKEYPVSNAGYRFAPMPLADRIAGPIRPTLYLLAGITFLLLLIATANVANLLLARGATRQREFAIRQALGAAAPSIVRQLLIESLVLASVGGALGTLLAWWVIRALQASNPWGLPRIEELTLDVCSLLFAVAASAGTALVSGLAPAWQAVGEQNPSALRDTGSRGGGETAGAARLRSALVVAEVAIAIVMLTGAGLLLESLRRLMAVDPGFSTAGVMTTELTLPMRKFGKLDATAAFVETYLDRLRGAAGVSAAGAAIALPIGARYNFTEFRLQGDAPPAVLPTAGLTPVTRGYFEAMGIPLRQGRYFDERDTRESPKTIVLSEPMARQYFGGRGAIGRRLSILVAPGLEFDGEIIGVVGGVRHESLAQDPRVEMYIPYAQLPYPVAVVVVRANGTAASTTALMKGVMRGLDKDLPLYQVRSMEDVVRQSASESRSRGVLTALFAGAALLLASFGIYGVMTYTVSRRTQEIGVRVAMGATPLDVIGLMIRQSGRVVFTGLGLGLGLALTLAQLLRQFLFQTSAFDPGVLASVAMLLMGSALFATIVPAWRAARIPPVQALRQE
jgi:putative ABC transport system permease protein